MALDNLLSIHRIFKHLLLLNCLSSTSMLRLGLGLVKMYSRYMRTSICSYYPPVFLYKDILGARILCSQRAFHFSGGV
jgi:hypothetical protein